MNGFDLPPALAGRADRGTLAHAYLLAGAQDAALERAALALAAAYLCQGGPPRPCGACRACRKVAQSIHPDVIAVEGAEGKGLQVDQIRALRADAYIRPNEAARKVYILKRAYQMTEAAQNAFLKVLEEGPAYAVFLLLAPNAAALLPTVRSRCEEIRVTAPDPAADPELDRRAGELAGLLLGEDTWRLISWCVPYEKLSREEAVSLWEETRKALLTYRRAGDAAKAVRLAQVLGEMSAAVRENANIGALWGRLWAEAGGQAL